MSRVIGAKTSALPQLNETAVAGIREAKHGVVKIKSNVTECGASAPGHPMVYGRSCGTGFCIMKNERVLWFLTNNHVVANNPTVVLYARHLLGEVGVVAHVVGQCEKYDVAVVEVRLATEIKADGDLGRGEFEALSRITMLEFDSSMDLEEGMQVVAIGHSLGSDDVVTTFGTITRRLQLAGNAAFGIQAPINHGNSGGPLMAVSGHRADDKLRVVGVNYAGVDGAQNVCYAIRSCTALMVVREIVRRVSFEKTRGRVHIPPTDMWSLQPLDDDLRTALGISVTSAGPEAGALSLRHDEGVLITGSPDALLSRIPSIRVGDVLLSIECAWPYSREGDFVPSMFFTGSLEEQGPGVRPRVTVFLKGLGVIRPVYTEGDLPKWFKYPEDSYITLAEFFAIVPWNWPMTAKVLRVANTAKPASGGGGSKEKEKEETDPRPTWTLQLCNSLPRASTASLDAIDADKRWMIVAGLSLVEIRGIGNSVVGITHVAPESYFDRRDVEEWAFERGGKLKAVVIAINCKPIHTLEDVSAALATPLGGKYHVLNLSTGAVLAITVANEELASTRARAMLDTTPSISKEVKTKEKEGGLYRGGGGGGSSAGGGCSAVDVRELVGVMRTVNSRKITPFSV